MPLLLTFSPITCSMHSMRVIGLVTIGHPDRPAAMLLGHGEKLGDYSHLGSGHTGLNLRIMF